MQKSSGNKNQGIRNVIQNHQGTNGSRQSKRDILFCPTPLLKGTGADELEYLTAPSNMEDSNDINNGGLKE